MTLGRRRTLYGAFHDYVRGVFAERSVRQRAVRASRTRWLHGFAQRPASSTSQHWQDEGRTGRK